MLKKSPPKKYRREVSLNDKVGLKIRQAFGSDVWYYKASDRVRKGVIDIILCFRGMFVGIELKKDLTIDGPTPLQTHNIAKIKQAGGFAFSADTVEDVLRILNYIKNDYVVERRS